MFTKTRIALFALAAVAAIGAASLVTSTAADARGFGGGAHSGGARHIGGGAHLGGGRTGGINRVGNFRPRIKIGHRGVRPTGKFSYCKIAHAGCHHHHRHHWWWRNRILVGGVVGGYVAPSYAVAPVAAPAAPCTCLRKDYTPDNQVVFQDVCTKEVAAAPAGNQALLPVK